MSKEPLESNTKKELTQTANKSLKMFNHPSNQKIYLISKDWRE